MKITAQILLLLFLCNPVYAAQKTVSVGTSENKVDLDVNFGNIQYNFDDVYTVLENKQDAVTITEVSEDVATFMGLADLSAIQTWLGITPSTFTLTTSISDVDATGDSFTIRGAVYDAGDTPVIMSGLADNSTITYAGSNVADCTGTGTTGSTGGPWTVTTSDSNDNVDCVIIAGSTGPSSATEILRPSSASGTSQSWTSSDGYKWDALNDVTPDGDASYVYATNRNVYQDIELETTSLTTETINSVTLHQMCRGETAESTMFLRLEGVSSGVDYTGTDGTVSTTYTEVSHTWTTNPETLNAWTVSDLGEFRVELAHRTLDQTVRCTAVWMEVNYQ